MNHDAAQADAQTLLAPEGEPLATAPTVVDARGDAGAPAALVSTARTTVLPCIEGDGVRLRLIRQAKARYEPVKLLGAGGMGEVVLVHDQDIARPVAIKRLLPDMEDTALLARFVDEIRTVGRLEHPNIVPVHDVGVDERGRYYFVMKYVEGETLEAIIAKLAAGDPEYHRKYTFELRAEIFISVLQALAYAHAHGVVHRDVKPANVMVGHYGEVMLMDWGIAKPIASERDPAALAQASIGDEGSSERGRMYATRVGAIVGTPAYMSPEQARGEGSRADARSDLYSASVLLYELMSLRHYLTGRTSSAALLAAVISEEISIAQLFAAESPHQRRPPAEILYLIQRGLAKDPARRPGSASEMIATLQGILEGRFDVRCHVTLTKRALRETARCIDSYPRLTFAVLLGIVAALISSGIQLIRLALA